MTAPIQLGQLETSGRAAIDAERCQVDTGDEAAGARDAAHGGRRERAGDGTAGESGGATSTTAGAGGRPSAGTQPASTTRSLTSASRRR